MFFFNLHIPQIDHFENSYLFVLEWANFCVNVCKLVTKDQITVFIMMLKMDFLQVKRY